MNPTTKPKRSSEQRAEEEEIRRQHAANPVRTPPAAAINQEGFTAILRLIAKFQSLREQQGLTRSEVATRMGVDAHVLDAIESGMSLNPTLATLHKWAAALGQRLEIELTAD